VGRESKAYADILIRRDFPTLRGMLCIFSVSVTRLSTGLRAVKRCVGDILEAGYRNCRLGARKILHSSGFQRLSDALFSGSRLRSRRPWLPPLNLKYLYEEGGLAALKSLTKSAGTDPQYLRQRAKGWVQASCPTFARKLDRGRAATGMGGPVPPFCRYLPSAAAGYIRGSKPSAWRPEQGVRPAGRR